MRFAESIEAGMTRLELNQWEANSLSGAVPAVTIDGATLFVNFLGYILALDLDSGKMLCALGRSIISKCRPCSQRPG